MTPCRVEPFLDFLTEPAFVIRRSAEILHANVAARRLLRTDPRSHGLFDFVVSPHDEFDRFLRRCSGTTSPLVGSVKLGIGSESSWFRMHCARLRDGGEDVRLGLRCLPQHESEFSVLASRVRALNVELRNRIREKAVLEEALRENRNLLRELQHRVKNNIQMMLSLIAMSARGEDSAEVRRVLDTARLRLQAMATTQESIYRSQLPGSVAAPAFLEGLVEAIGQSVEPSPRRHQRVADAELSHDLAHGLALITNELVTNAIKHGLNGCDGTIAVRFERVDGDLQLMVQDSGSGFDPDASGHSSGLRLVRGLCRQIGGSLVIENEGGARCVVRIRDGGQGRRIDDAPG